MADDDQRPVATKQADGPGFYTADGKVPYDLPCQEIACGIDAPHQRPNATFIECSQDWSQPLWVKQFSPQLCYPGVSDPTKVLAVQGLSPLMRLSGEYYDTYLAQHAGASDGAGAPGTIDLRLIDTANYLPYRDEDTMARRQELKDNVHFHQEVRHWARFVDKSVANDAKVDDELLDSYFASEKQRKYDLVFEGIGNDRLDQAMQTFGNHAHACMTQGQNTVVNWGTETLRRGDKIRFIPPRVGKTLICLETNQLIHKFLTIIKNELDRKQVHDRLPFEAHRITDPNIESFHAVVEKGAHPGQQMLVKIHREGQYTSAIRG